MNAYRSAIALLGRGDWAVLATGAVAVMALVVHYWMSPAGQHLVIKRGGNVFLTASLARAFSVEVPGPLGVTQVEVVNHRARVRSDPGPRQLCVHQGWISHEGEAAICLPNQVSVEIVGQVRRYDSLNY
ncbi:MAG: NusG domain II-containing protein [Sulfuriferula sp.]|nr:NusG domain II-containing protein [Sulfuriferula sp.]